MTGPIAGLGGPKRKLTISRPADFMQFNDLLKLGKYWPVFPQGAMGIKSAPVGMGA